LRTVVGKQVFEATRDVLALMNSAQQPINPNVSIVGYLVFTYQLYAPVYDHALG
jgi:hypothetical protein